MDIQYHIYAFLKRCPTVSTYYFLVFEEMDIYLAPHGSGLQQGGGPRPLRHKGGGGQPRIHVPAGIKGNVQGILYQ